MNKSLLGIVLVIGILFSITNTIPKRDLFIRSILLVIGILFSENVFSQQSYPYKNPKLNSEERTLDLLGRIDRKSVV